MINEKKNHGICANESLTAFLSVTIPEQNSQNAGVSLQPVKKVTHHTASCTYD